MFGSAVQTISIDFIANYRSNLAGLDRDIQRMSGSAQQAGKKVGQSLTGIGKFSQVAGTALLVGVGAALAVGVKAAIDFESAFAGVKKTLEGSDSQFEALAMSIRSMATDIPIAATELARIGELGGQLGVPIEAMEEFIEVIALLGVTTTLSVEEAATTMARFANIMGTSFDDFDNFGSTIVDLGNNFATTEGEILNFGTRLAGIGSTIGISEQDVLGLAAGFTALGEPAERGATALQRVFVNMQKFADTKGEGLYVLADVMGLTADAAAELIKTDPAEAFLQFERGIRQVVLSGGNVTETLDRLGLGAVRTTTTILKGAAGVGILTDALNTSNTAWLENNALQIEADKRFETTASQLILLKNQATEFGIALGEGALPAVKEMVTFLQGLVGVITDNIDVLKIFALAVGVLGIGRLISKIGSAFTNAANNATHFEGAILRTIGANQKFSTGLRFLGGGLGIAAIALGAIAIAMSNAKARANEMEAAVKDLDEVLQDNAATAAELRDAYVNAFNATTATKPGALFANVEDIEQADELLGRLGLSTADFIDLVIEGGPAWDDFKKRAVGALEAAAGVGEKVNQTGETQQFLDQASQDLDLILELIAKGEQLRGELRQISDIRVQVGIFGANAAELDDKQMIINARKYAADNAKIWEAAISDEQGLLDILTTNFLGDEDAAQDFYDDFLQTSAEFGADFAEEWAEVIDNLNAGLDDWGSAWDEYEEVQRVSTAEMTKSIEAWKKDQIRLTDALQFVTENFGAEYVKLWATLPTELQAQIAATLAELGPEAAMAELDAVFNLWTFAVTEGVKRIFMAAPAGAAIGMDAWSSRFVETAQQMVAGGITQGTPEWVAAMAAAFSTEMEEQTPEVQAAWNTLLGESMEEVVKGLPENFDLEAFTADMTTVERIQAFHDMGFSWADAVALGWASLPALMGGTAGAAATKVDKIFKGKMGVESPSKVAMYWGQMVGEGFNLGLMASLGSPLESAIGSIANPRNVANATAGAGADSSSALAKALSNLNNSSGGLQVVFNGDVANEDKVGEKIQRSVGLANMTRLAEIAPGRS